PSQDLLALNTATGTVVASYVLPSVVFPSIPQKIYDIIAHNNVVYVFAKESSSNAFLYKLNYTPGIGFTVLAIADLGIIPENTRMAYNDTDDLLYLAKNVNDTSVSISTNINQPSSITMYNGTDLGVVGTPLSLNVLLSDIAYKKVDNTLLIASHANASPGSSGAFLRKYNADLDTEIWAASETFTGDEFIISPQISFLNDNIYMTGLYHANTAFDLTNLPIGSGQSDIFALRLQDLGTSVSRVSETDVEIVETIKKDLIISYPNPIEDVLNVKLSNPNANYEVTIHDFTGEKILSERSASNVKEIITIDTKKLAKGLYIVHVKKNGEIVYTSKIKK
ncbi:MAG: T9SS type A sorting domain-containing protein, partial [Flavobacteriaceae bacterium]|nr:T9SS type A sorting domain-containing protein [Flavobacteriaceae bacterium]